MEELKQFLQDYNLTQEQAAAIFGVKQSAWNYWQNDKRQPPDYFLKAWKWFHRLNRSDRLKEIDAAKDNNSLESDLKPAALSLAAE